MLNKLSNKEIEAIRYIRNSLMHKGKAPSVRDLMNLLGYKSPRSAAIIIDSLLDKKILDRDSSSSLKLHFQERIKDNQNNAETVDIPLVGVAACGQPLLAEENIEAYVPISIRIAKPSNKYFILRAKGDSMNNANINGYAINNGDLVLIKQQQTAQNGDTVVALIDDDATIKEFHNNGDIIVLKPKSNNNKHQPIILTSDFRIQGIVVNVIPI